MNRWLIISLSIISFDSLNGQIPCGWTFTPKKIADRTWEIHCLVDVNAPWHIYSQFTADGGPLPTKFQFLKNPLCSLDGSVREVGKMTIMHEPVFGVDVKYFEGRVDFVQQVKLKAATKTNLSGTVEFMLCNDAQCLPPVSQKFTISLN